MRRKCARTGLVELLEGRVHLSGGGASLAWAVEVGGPLKDDGAWVLPRVGGGVVVAGHVGEEQDGWVDTNGPLGKQDIFVGAVTAEGQALERQYIGGRGEDVLISAKADAAGNIILVGMTGSSEFTGHRNNLHGSMDVFVTKLSTSLAPMWTVFVGGGGMDLANSVVVDSGGNIFVSGTTMSSNLEGSLNGFAGGELDGMIAMITPAGQQRWARYIGGSGTENSALVYGLDASENPIVVGQTESANLAGATNRYGGMADGYMARIGRNGAQQLAMYIGGSGVDDILDIEPDGAGGALISGTTMSYNLPGAANSTRGGGDVFVTRVNSQGAIQWTRYLGGTGYDWGYVTTIPGSTDLLASGTTTSTDLPGALNGNGGQTDTWVARLSATGAVKWSRYVGGSGYDDGTAMAIDADTIVAGGSVTSNDVAGTENSSYGGEDVLLAVLDAAGAQKWARYLGGGYGDTLSITEPVVAGRDVYISGTTTSLDFNGQTGQHKGLQDVFVAKVALGAAAPTAPAAPAELAASAVGATGLTLSWKDQATGETGYQVERSTDGKTFAKVATVGANRTTYVDRGLAPGRRYTYRVVAVSGAGASAYSNVVSVKTAVGPEIAVFAKAGAIGQELFDNPKAVVQLGEYKIGGKAPVFKFTVVNRGNKALVLSGVKAPAGFKIAQALPKSLAAGASAVFGIQPIARKAAMLGGPVQISSNDADERVFDFSVSLRARQ